MSNYFEGKHKKSLEGGGGAGGVDRAKALVLAWEGRIDGWKNTAGQVPCHYNAFTDAVSMVSLLASC